MGEPSQLLVRKDVRTVAEDFAERYPQDKPDRPKS